jgi:hypothetical protein
MSAMAYLIACVWSSEPDAQYPMYFRNDIPEKNNYYYSYFNFYDTSADQESDKEQNIEEWKKYLGGKLPDQDVEQLIYDVPLTGLKEIYDKAKKHLWTKIDSKWLDNSMMRRIVLQRNMSALEYLLYAKACEQQAGKRSEDWEYTLFDSNIQDSLLHRGIQLYKASKTEFIRLRYAFQIVRMAYYCGYKEDCVRYYQEMIMPETKSNAMAKLWALAFYAGATESKAEAAYCYSRVFNKCPRYSHAAMTSFRWMIHEMDTSWISIFCKNNFEKAVGHAMIGFTCFQPTLDPLEKVHQFCPQIPYIETLLIREINKIEDRLNTDDKASALQHAEALKELSVRYAGIKLVQHPALWYAAAAYMAYLSKEYDQATLLIDIAEQEQPEPKITEQLLAIRLLIDTESSPLDSITEAHILPSIQWILSHLQDTVVIEENHDFFDRMAAHYFAEKLPEIYLRNRQPVKAAFCIGIAGTHSAFANYNYTEFDIDALDYLDTHASATQLDHYLSHPPINAYDSVLFHLSGLTRDDILELLGTKHLRLLEFKIAATYFEQLSGSSAFFHLTHHPFSPLPISYKEDHEPGNEDLFSSKLSFANEMAELQDRILHSKPSPDDLFQYATGLFQMSWYGNSWQLSNYYWSIHEADFWKETTPNGESSYYYHTQFARDYFIKACDLSKDKEFKAKCLFMASHCYQMNSSSIYIWADGKYTFGSYFTNNPYFEQLTKKYKKTDFYKDAIRRCSYLSDFANMKK